MALWLVAAGLCFVFCPFRCPIGVFSESCIEKSSPRCGRGRWLPFFYWFIACTLFILVCLFAILLGIISRLCSVSVDLPGQLLYCILVSQNLFPLHQMVDTHE